MPRLDNTRNSARRRIWLVNHYADAPDRANGTRHFDLAKRLSTSGFDVTIIASGFSHVTGREERLRRGQLYRTESFEGVRFAWLRTIPYRGNGWRRQVNMLSFVASLLVVQTRLKAPDAIVGSTVHPFAALGAWLVARTRGARYVFEVRDLWPQTLVDLGALRLGSPGERLLRGIEAFLVRRAAVVVTVLPGMQDYLIERGLPHDHVRYIPNGVDLEAFDAAALADRQLPELTACLSTISQMKRDGRVVFGYLGALGRVNGVSEIIHAASLAEARAPGKVGVVIAGDGPLRDELTDLARDHASVVLVGPIPKRVVPQVLAAIDAGIVHATANPVYRYGISFNKLFEYFAASRPVVFACTSNYDPVATAGAGLSLPPDDPSTLADALIELAEASPETRRRMGAAGRACVSSEHNIRTLAAIYGEAVSGISES
jgi:glycosyltransferase involved in cell wall biosynthesis